MFKIIENYKNQIVRVIVQMFYKKDEKVLNT